MEKDGLVARGPRALGTRMWFPSAQIRGGGGGGGGSRWMVGSWSFADVFQFCCV